MIQKKQRNMSLDILRIMATIAVITIHVTGQHWMSQNINSFSWAVYNFYRCISRWAVPVFIMISGTLFLNPEKPLDLKKLYKKNILRIVTAYIFWSLLYAIYENNGGIMSFVKKWLLGSGHMWFIYLILFLYLILPFTRWIMQNEKISNRALFICFVLGFLCPCILESIPAYFGIKLVTGRILLIIKIIQKLFGWIGYYCLGWKIQNTDLKNIKKYLIYIVGSMAFVASFFLFMAYAKKLQYAPNEFYDNISITVLAEAIFVFTLMKNIKWNMSDVVSNKIQKISKMTFGIYMVHMIIYWNLDSFIYTLNISTVIYIPFMMFFTFIISFGIVCIIDKIPVIRKYII